MKVIKDGKLRIGTSAPYGWVNNTLANRIAYKFLWRYNCTLLRALFGIFIERPLRRSLYIITKKYWRRLRCSLGFHQENMYGFAIDGKMFGWCFWCNIPLGEKLHVDNLDEYEHIINRTFKKRK